MGNKQIKFLSSLIKSYRLGANILGPTWFMLMGCLYFQLITIDELVLVLFIHYFEFEAF